MAKKIEVVGAKHRKLEVAGKTKRRLEPAELAAALGAKPESRQQVGGQDLLGLAELGTQLLARLRSSGGRPALADATEICRVPLTAEDAQTLERMATRIEESSGAKASIGQLVSVIVRTHLDSLKSLPPSEGLGQERAASLASIQKMLDEQLTPLRDKVERLEKELLAVRGK